MFPATEELIGKIVKVKITKAGYPYNEGQFVKVENDLAENNAVNAAL